MNNEPVTITAAINAALVSSWGLLVLIFDISDSISAAVSVMMSTWIIAIALIVRGKVTPVGNL